MIFQKVHYLMKTLTLRLIKSDKNYFSITIVFLYTSAYQMNFQFKNYQKFWWILIVYHKIGQFFCVFCKSCHFSLCKHWPTSSGRSNLKLTHFKIKNQDLSKVLKIFELKVLLKKYMYENYSLIVRLFKL